MLVKILARVNWVDVLAIILLFRVCYIAFKNGLAQECFKLIGTIIAIYLGMHYYSWLADFIRDGLGLSGVSIQALDFYSFLGLAIAGYAVFVVLRELFCRLVKMEAVPVLNKGGGVAVGFFRGILFSSLVIFMLLVSGIQYVQNSILESYSGRHLFNLSYSVYRGLWMGVVSKFSPQDEFNKNIYIIQDHFNKK
jgi:uncharacterized membrane protein required for colicin V production